MQQHEWQQIAAVMENAWRGDWDDARSDAYFLLLEEFDAVQVSQALRVLVRNGSPFIPAAAEIVAAIDAAGSVGSATWDECWQLVRRVIKRRGRRGEAKAFDDLQAADPLVASWVATYGWGRLCGEEVEHPQYGPATMRRLRESFEQHVERQRDRRRHGLAIEAVARRSLSGPRKVDAAVLLGGAA